MTTLLSLNVWGGKLFDPLMAYVEDVSSHVDIFCFQEVLSTVSDRQYDQSGKWRIDLLSQMSIVLPEFVGYYAPAIDCFFETQNYNRCYFSYGLATFVHKDIPILCAGDVVVSGNRGLPISQDEFLNHQTQRNLQYVIIGDGHEPETMIANFHGLWTGKGKQDTPQRIAQSQNVIRFLDQSGGKKILCGDFNLRPNTQSFQLLAHGMRNLVKEYQIYTTRSSYYDKCAKEPYADYILTSSVEIEKFLVDPTEVSDHLALLLQF